MFSIISRCTTACALTTALALTIAAPAGAAEHRNNPVSRQAAEGRATTAGFAAVAAMAWQSIQALWANEGGMIDPDGHRRPDRQIDLGPLTPGTHGLAISGERREEPPAGS